ncbi:MAG: hypothetical protein H7Z43_07650 [Clostridia bacterium]|nr:hypothetical protein [Deltaproteobacteria bacterium]
MAKEGEQQLLDEVAGLPVEEILALCYSFKAKPQRLRLYSNALRRRGGERAQFASCLICFDLARQGDEVAQIEFNFLADTMRALADKDNLAISLVAGDDYLEFVWDLCRNQLDDMDPRFGAEVPPPSPPEQEIAVIDLITDNDFDDFVISVEDTAMWRRFDEAVEVFLGGTVGVPIYDPTSGFRLENHRDVSRVEKFLQELDSLREYVPISRGFRALTMLFYGSHMRSKSVFGAVNKRKQTMLCDGLDEFIKSGPAVWEVVGVLGPLHAPAEVLERVSALLVDYISWMAENPVRTEQGVKGYDPVARLVQHTPARGLNRRSAER